MRSIARLALPLVAAIAVTSTPGAQAPGAAGAKAAVHARQVKRLLITNAMIIPGTGVPASGPSDILVEDGLIARIGSSAAGRWPDADAIIDGTGKYVMPGIVNTHMHWHEERVGPIPIQYERNLYLAAGVTTAREVGGNFEKTKQWRAESAAHTIVAPRIVLYPMLANLLQRGPGVQSDAGRLPRARARRPKSAAPTASSSSARWRRIRPRRRSMKRRKLGFPTTVHVAVGEATARDFVDVGVNCIEHFYGVADAALDGIQDFPPEMNLRQRDPPLRPRRRAVHPEQFRSREAVEAARRHGRQRRGVEPDDVHLRGRARPDPGAEPARGTRTTCIRRSRSTTSRA